MVHWWEWSEDAWVLFLALRVTQYRTHHILTLSLSLLMYKIEVIFASYTGVLQYLVH